MASSELGKKGIRENVVMFAIILLVAILILEFAFHVDHNLIYFLEVTEFACMGIIAVDLLIKFSEASDKVFFLRRNLLEIPILLPAGALFAGTGRMFRGFAILEGLEIARVMKVVRGTKHIGEFIEFLPAFLFFSKPEYIKITDEMMEV